MRTQLNVTGKVTDREAEGRAIDALHQQRSRTGATPAQTAHRQSLRGQPLYRPDPPKPRRKKGLIEQLLSC